MKDEELDIVYSKYKLATNMSYSELLLWSNNPCSKKASIGRAAIKRNLFLLKDSKEKWGIKHIREAKKAISYLARAKKIKSTNIICGGYTRNEIALKNWAFDINK
jgi:hypothetical protein